MVQDQTISDLPDLAAMWERVGKLAQHVDPGMRIRVLDEHGKIIAGIGVISARRLLGSAQDDAATAHT